MLHWNLQSSRWLLIIATFSGVSCLEVLWWPFSGVCVVVSLSWSCDVMSWSLEAALIMTDWPPFYGHIKTSTIVIGTLSTDGWDVTFGFAARRGLGPKCNGPPINGQTTNFQHHIIRCGTIITFTFWRVNTCNYNLLISSGVVVPERRSGKYFLAGTAFR